jgi:hypothetical protein
MHSPGYFIPPCFTVFYRGQLYGFRAEVSAILGPREMYSAAGRMRHDCTFRFRGKLRDHE